jgi:LPXTG-motif cell wall-anchored protein
VTLSVTVEWVYGKPIAPPDLAAANIPAKGDEGHSHPGKDKPRVITYPISKTVKAPENCPQPTQPPAEAASPILDQDCDSMTIGLHNPVKGEEIVLHLTPSTGAERTLVAKPGKDTTTTFEGVKPGFSVKIRYEGEEGGETVLYRQPKDCDTGGTAGGGDTGGLPVTGAAAGTIAGGAAVLLLAGGSMFVLARRRKVKFTA